MKVILSIMPLLFTTLLAHADLIVQQKVQGPVTNGIVVIKLKGDQIRMDMPAGPAGAVSTLIDFKAGSHIALLHSQKVLFRTKLSDFKAMSQNLFKAEGFNPNKTRAPQPTGEKEKIGKWNTEVFSGTLGGRAVKLWVSKDVEHGEALREGMKKVEATGGDGNYSFDVPGVIVKSETTGEYGLMTVTLVQVDDAAVAETEFRVPSDYKERAFPQK